VKKWKVENFIDLELLKTIAFEVRNPKEVFLSKLI